MDLDARLDEWSGIEVRRIEAKSEVSTARPVSVAQA